MKSSASWGTLRVKVSLRIHVFLKCLNYFSLIFLIFLALYFCLQGKSLYFLLIFAYSWWFIGSGFLGCDFGLGIFGFVFWVDGVGFGDLWCGTFWVFWSLISLYKHRRKHLRKNFAVLASICLYWSDSIVTVFSIGIWGSNLCYYNARGGAK